MLKRNREVGLSAVMFECLLAAAQRPEGVMTKETDIPSANRNLENAHTAGYLDREKVLIRSHTNYRYKLSKAGEDKLRHILGLDTQTDY